jgi:hypothetical protein
MRNLKSYDAVSILISPSEVADLKALLFEIEQAYFEEHGKTLHPDDDRSAGTLDALITRERFARRRGRV